MFHFQRVGLRLLVLLIVSCAFSQSTIPAASDVDFPALLRETQQSVGEAGYVGMVWWIPPQYWQLSAERMGRSSDKSAEQYKSLKQYTMVVVALGKVGIGNVNWFSETEIRENLSMRDSEGNEYRPLEKVSGDAQGLVSILKPVFANILGAMGQNCVIVFLPGLNKMAEPLADPLAHGSFSLKITKLVAGKDKVFEWALPLTTLSPAKYCPVGKERVQANWKYCPWHGVKLDSTQAAAEPK